jgi:hypothetical protein
MQYFEDSNPSSNVEIGCKMPFLDGHYLDNWSHMSRPRSLPSSGLACGGLGGTDALGGAGGWGSSANPSGCCPPRSLAMRSSMGGCVENRFCSPRPDSGFTMNIWAVDGLAFMGNRRE